MLQIKQLDVNNTSLIVGGAGAGLQISMSANRTSILKAYLITFNNLIRSDVVGCLHHASLSVRRIYFVEAGGHNVTLTLARHYLRVSPSIREIMWRARAPHPRLLPPYPRRRILLS